MPSKNIETVVNSGVLRVRRWKLFALLLVVIWCVLTAFSTSWIQNDKNAALSQLMRLERQALAIYMHSLADSLDHVFSDLRWLPRQNELLDWTRTHSPEVLARLTQEYRTLLVSKPIYDSVRFVDTAGREVARANYQSGEAQIVDAAALRDVGQRYFVQKGLALGAGEVYLSQLDLKAEDGVFVTPHKPLLRFIAPVFDHDGVRHGLVMLSYNVMEMMADLRSAAANYPGELNLLNASGYWLMAPLGEREWGDLFPERQAANLASIEPELWRLVQERANGQREYDSGIYTFASVTPQAYWSTTPGASVEPEMLAGESVDGAGRWILMSHVNWDYVQAYLERYRSRIIAFSIANIILAGVLAMLISHVWFKRQEHRAELEVMAFFDQLTGLANRANFYQKLEKDVNSSLRHGHDLAVCLVDLDGFKTINDTLGHDGGDQALIETARRFRDGIRQSDLVARVGGDEFMILLSHVNGTDDAIEVAKKVLDQLAQPLLIKGRSCRLGASIGISLCPLDSSDPETLWHLADMAMYRAKSSGKNRFCFFNCKEDHGLVCRTQGSIQGRQTKLSQRS